MTPGPMPSEVGFQPLPASLETLPNGRRVRVARLGSGPPVVMLHGYPENLHVWARVAPRLAERFEVRALDWPGLGASDAWSGGATPTAMADRLVALLDAWGLERAALVALDMGGQPALVAAARHAPRVSALVVMNSLVMGDESTSWEIRVLRRYRWNERILRLLPRVVFRRACRTFLPRGERLPAALRAEFWAHFRKPEVRRFLSRMCAGYQAELPRLPAHYARIACPTLVLWGERDSHFPPVHARRLSACIPGATLELLRDAGHWMPWSHAEAVAERVDAFLYRALLL